MFGYSEQLITKVAMCGLFSFHHFVDSTDMVYIRRHSINHLVIT